MALEAGSLVVVPFPFSNLHSAKRRPVLLLTAPDTYGDFIAMAVTSQAGHAHGIALLPADMRAGTLPKASWVRTDKIISLNRALVVKEVGKAAESLRIQAACRLCARLQLPPESLPS
ncbi:MAG: type II toxin-antitoxin system PemK/MazF family toxin [Candidatus Competibacter sp.]|nr:type II toxin-antitoxin system PemK/MazF family toxin [Candidatus Competibacter sp.]